mmetsp:Transcript_73593/g.208481  ORF Transcript_73593/g.208481 Transcript_73593/m.208481 type:complete len:306 (+) Transcript_73593:448-1365(+)
MSPAVHSTARPRMWASVILVDSGSRMSHDPSNSSLPGRWRNVIFTVSLGDSLVISHSPERLMLSASRQAALRSSASSGDLAAHPHQAAATDTEYPRLSATPRRMSDARMTNTTSPASSRDDFMPSHASWSPMKRTKLGLSYKLDATFQSAAASPSALGSTLKPSWRIALAVLPRSPRTRPAMRLARDDCVCRLRCFTCPKSTSPKRPSSMSSTLPGCGSPLKMPAFITEKPNTSSSVSTASRRSVDATAFLSSASSDGSRSSFGAGAGPRSAGQPALASSSALAMSKDASSIRALTALSSLTPSM